MRLAGEPLYVTVSVVCDSADAEVTVEVEGLMTTGSSCVYDPGTTRTTSNGGGNTGSMQIAVEAWATRFRTRHREKVTDATFTFVAIDDEGRPRQVPARPDDPIGV